MISTLHLATYSTKLKFKKGKFKNEPANTAITIFLSEYQVHWFAYTFIDYSLN